MLIENMAIDTKLHPFNPLHITNEAVYVIISNGKKKTCEPVNLIFVLIVVLSN